MQPTWVEPPPAETVKGAIRPSRVRPGAVLIVEDEFLIRMMLSETLGDHGFAVLEAGTGDDALTILRGEAPVALMLTDLSLPGTLDGLALAGQARLLHAMLPIVFMTGRPDAVAPGDLTARDAVVAKPYLPSDVVAVVQRLLLQ